MRGIFETKLSSTLTLKSKLKLLLRYIKCNLKYLKFNILVFNKFCDLLCVKLVADIS